MYNEGLDPQADAETAGALVDQFQAPLDADADVEDNWVEDATRILRQIEDSWQHKV
ncbi:YugN family protein [Gordoniibacillus kamchatkensis]|uniref:YugN family protein n=1 Tax=Gordoniibacillus kamchatkensis TaxID=1590651 RepID=UPI000A8611C5|nr:YugN family protein [Paenibacillus sp. VKM B-2647]